jgi:pyruvate ferredoxin oxidoreductase gamma subunit
VLLGRGGQGAKTAAMLMAEVLVALGHHAVGQPAYGPERSGAPMRAYVRVSDRAICGREPVLRPWLAALLDSTLASKEAEVLGSVAPDGWVLVNSSLSPDALRAELPPVNARVAAIDATRIAVEEGGEAHPNAPMIGAVARLMGIAEIDALAGAMSSRTAGHGREAAEGNRRAVIRGAAEVVPCPGAAL